MPWLTVHVVLPIVLLGAWALGRTLSYWAARTPAPAMAQPASEGQELADPGNANGHAPSPLFAPVRPRLWDDALIFYLCIFGAVAALFFLLISSISRPANSQQQFAPFVFPATLLLLGLITLFAGLLRGTRWAIGALALGATLTLALYGARSAYQLSYRWGDDARELLVFVQTSPDVPRVVRQLEQAATKRGGDLAVWYDNETVWQWYMRRFEKATQQQPTLPPPGEDVMAVLLLQENIDANQQNLLNLQGFRVQRYPLRWWNPEHEIYRLPPQWTSAAVTADSPLLMRMLRTPFDGRTAAQFWQYMIYRQPPAPLGSTDFVLAVRPELANEIGLGTGTEQK
jgi:hypothetical protein